MNCSEFQRDLADIMDDGGDAQQQAHLSSCFACSSLVSDLNTISEQARLLQASEEPSPRVWNSLEIALRQEGLIRQAQREHIPALGFAERWRAAWLVPVAAILLLTFGVMMYRRPVERQQVAKLPPAPAVLPPAQTKATAAASSRSNDDRRLLEEVGSRSPAMRAAYETNLQNVNAYIRDAEESAEADPTDEEAQQSLMDAYQQRAMVYELAFDRSLP